MISLVFKIVLGCEYIYRYRLDDRDINRYIQVGFFIALDLTTM